MRAGRVSLRGFTIVELLIVIVVIAILAAITIVAYNGIMDRSKNTQVVSATSAYVKAIRAYYAANNDTVPMQSNAVQCFDGTGCWGGSSTADAATLRTELRKVSPTLASVPKDRAILVTNGTTTDVSGGNYSGWYVLYQVINFDNQCPAVGGLRYLNGGNVTDSNVRNCRGALEF